jgi:hypothetical protein
MPAFVKQSLINSFVTYHSKIAASQFSCVVNSGFIFFELHLGRYVVCAAPAQQARINYPFRSGLDH